MLQVVLHVSRLPFLPIRVRGIFSYLLAMKWIISIPMYHQLSNSGLSAIWCHIGYQFIHSNADPCKHTQYEIRH